MVFNDLQFLNLTPPEPEQDDPYITFRSPSSFTLKTYNTSKNWDGTLEYSTDTSTWNTWDGTEITAASNDTEYDIFLRGTDNTYITGYYSTNKKFVLSGSNISCSGNIENLLDYETVAAGSHPSMTYMCYGYLFNGCTSIISAPKLSSTSLANYCYADMFYGCTSLTTAPELPATTMKDSCYREMFRGCTSLTTAPELPATSLSSNCYISMFYGCTSLTTAPELPATSLANYCYDKMFYGCTSLTTAPELPATSLANYCYREMFNRCTSLVNPPQLNATILKPNCYNQMFLRCTSLRKLPKFNATVLDTMCCYYMFSSCSSIKISATQTSEYIYEYKIPHLGTIASTSTDSITGLFANTGGTFTGNPTINTTYYTDNEPV